MKIYKDKHIIEVSPNAYESMYKRLGYEPYVENAKKISSNEEKIITKVNNKEKNK